MWKVHTNDGVRYVHASQKMLRKRMYEYIREKRAKGYKLNEIIFCWGPIRVEYWR